ncbi:MAG: AraC family transcriptional regulator [Polyangiaceae bacterium]
MQRPQDADYRPRIERALGFISSNLNRPLTLAEVARAAHLSEFHFHRVFSAIMREPVGRFITRKRLEVAALALAYEPRRSVTEIALSVGYSSASNFSKAFRAHFGCSPSQVRSGERLALEGSTERDSARLCPADLHVLPPDLPAAARAEAMAELQRAVRFEVKPDIPLACLASPEGYDFEALMRTWQELVARAVELGLANGGVDAHGLAHDSPVLTAPERCRYHACVPCAEDTALPAPLFRGKIPAGRYAVFTYSGPVSGVEEMYRRIYSIWLAASSLAPDDTVNVDHYTHDFPQNGRVEMEIWLKVVPRAD